MAMAWQECEGAASGEASAASRMWREACGALLAGAGAGAGEDAWAQVVAAAPRDDIWHSLNNCVAYQAVVWQRLASQGAADVLQPAAFRLAVVLRHTPADLAVKLLADMLAAHPQCEDLTSYVLALLTEDEASSSCCGADPPSPAGGPAPPRDLQLYADLELAVLAAPPAVYDRQARLVRAEYSQMTQSSYSEFRIKILNQLCMIPKLFLTPDFTAMEEAARDNIKREIKSLKEQQ